MILEAIMTLPEKDPLLHPHPRHHHGSLQPNSSQAATITQ
jgi:hypothetical protein